ncbi:DUF7059 domain-containing protein [Streptomyces sp. 4N509B]|uniref:DUF7059 domain-containing protein n=1 Tax=Streptomyces sp. 4N509B TaxID=3457413 RepID=UPI003FD48B5E
MTLTAPPTPGPGTARLRETLASADFTADGLLELLGAPAYAALARGEAVPALRATREAAADGGALPVLVRLFLLQRAVRLDVARKVLPQEAFDDGWLVPHRDGNGDDTVRARVDIRPYAGEGGQDWWIVSDPGRALPSSTGPTDASTDAPTEATDATDARDVVLGVGGASTTLAQLTVRHPVGRALDLGTGSGIQALHAAQHAGHVTATDVNPRALRMAALTLALSGAPPAELRQGSLYEPLRDAEPFDLIVANPPFVISPSTTPEAQRLTYRDAGLGGDAFCRALVAGAADHLADGGYCHLLANWEEPEGEDWRERLASWVPPGCDAWIIRREEQDVTEYTELWLRDAGVPRLGRQAYEKRYDEWLADFATRRVRAVGLGWITLRRTGGSGGTGTASVTVEDWPHAVEQPLGDTIRDHFARQLVLRGRAGTDEGLLASRLVVADGVVQEQLGEPGAEDPEHLVLRQRHGLMRARAVDTASAGLVGACDGTLPAGAIVDAIADLLGQEADALRQRLAPEIRSLVEQGFLVPA